MRTYSKEKYNCDNRDSEDAREDDTVKRMYKCFKCELAYTSKKDRYDHFRRVHFSHKFMLTCTQCRSKFKKMDELLAHLRACHPLLCYHQVDDLP